MIGLATALGALGAAAWSPSRRRVTAGFVGSVAVWGLLRVAGVWNHFPTYDATAIAVGVATAVAAIWAIARPYSCGGVSRGR